MISLELSITSIFSFAYFFTYQLLIHPETLNQKCTRLSNVSVIPSGALQTLSSVWTGFSASLQGRCCLGPSHHQYPGDFLLFSLSDPLFPKASSFFFLEFSHHVAETHPLIASEDMVCGRYLLEDL